MSRGASVKDLFAAAREDAPGAGARDAMWKSIAASLPATAAAAATTAATTSAAASVPPAVGVAAPAAGAAAPAAVTAATATAAKAAFLGAVVGSTLTIAVAAVALHGALVARNAADAPSAAAPPRADEADFRPPAVLTPQDSPSAPSTVPGSTSTPAAPHAASPTSTPSSPTSAAAVAAAADDDDTFSREVTLVTRARSALLRRDAAGCLDAVHAARALPVRQLEPEELGLEARALRMQGRFEEAAAVESTLRARFPGHALSR